MAKLHVAKTRELKKKKSQQKTPSPDLTNSTVNPSSIHNKSTLNYPSAGTVATASTKSSFADSQLHFDSKDFQSAILKLSRRYERADPRLNPPLLRVADGYLSRKYVRKEIWEQLEVKLNKKEIDAICWKLSYASTDEKAALTADYSQNPKLLIIGKELKALIVRIGHTVVKQIPKFKKESSVMGDTLTSSTLFEDSCTLKEEEPNVDDIVLEALT